MNFPDNPRCTVLIATWNRRSILGVVLDSVLRQSLAPQTEILVIDNASDDGTAEWIRQAYSGRIRLYRFEKNQGGSAGRNAGIRLARAPFVCFLDSDAVLLCPETLERCVDFLERQSANYGQDAHATSSLSSSYAVRAVAAPIWLDAEKTRPFCLGGYITEDGQFYHKRTLTERDDPMFLSTCFSVWERRFLVEDLRGFDPTFFLGLEDIDLGLRARAWARRAGRPNPMRILDGAGDIHHMLSSDGRVMKPEDFDFIFRKIERHRLYLLLASEGLGAFFRSVARGPFRIARWEREVWGGRPMSARERFLAAYAYPLRRLVALPYDLWRIHRNHLAHAPSPRPIE